MLYAFPIIIIAIGIFFRFVLSRKSHFSGRSVDLGEILLVIIMIYGFIPGLGFILAELGVAEILDGRLYYGYLVEQVEYVQLLFILLIFSFSVAYILFRKQLLVKLDHSAETVRLVWPTAAVSFGLTMVSGAIRIVWGADVGEDYISSYTALRSAPLLVQQIAGVADQLQFTFTVAAVSFAVAAWPKKHFYVALVLVANMFFVALSGGARTYAFLTFLAYIIAASIYVPTFRINRAVWLASLSLALFLIAGSMRGLNDEVSTATVLLNSEFTAVFVTPIDLHMRFPEGFAGRAPFNLYTVDLLRLIPAQLLPFEKTSPGEWYSSVFYNDYYAAGGGYAFGILAEIVLGLGGPEAVIRGALLGAIFALIANWLHRPDASPIKIFAYTWIIVLGYQCYRDTTFSIVGRAVFHLVPVLIFLTILQSNRAPKKIRKNSLRV